MTANEMKFASEIDQALNFYKTFVGERVLYDRGPSDFLPHVEQRRLLAFTGLASEAGEASDAYKKYFFHGKPLNEMRDKIILELGDVFWYFILACDSMNISVYEVIEKNMEKLDARSR